MKFYLCTFGCRVNQADGDAIAEALEADGHARTPDPEGADLLVVNSCTVTHRSDQDVRNRVRRLHRLNPRSRVVVTGCYGQREPVLLGQLPGVWKVLGARSAKALADSVRQEWGGEAAAPTSSGEACGSFPERDETAQPYAAEPPAPPLAPTVSRSGHTRPFVKVQDGCAGSCAYCIVPQVRGGPRSAAPDAVVRTVEELVRQGAREILLTGIHLGLYGTDLSPTVSLARLAARILDETPLESLRFSSIEPPEFDRGLLDLVARAPRVASHFHIPLQSGCDATLRRMNRTYPPELYRTLVENLSRLRPGCALGADLIVGFPGETEAEFSETLTFVDSLPLAYLHVFPFSPRPGTAAVGFADRVNPALVHERSQRLLAWSRERTRQFRQSFRGRPLPALVLSAGNTLAEGAGGRRPVGARTLTDNYIPVTLPGVFLPVNTRVNVRIESVPERGDPIGGLA